MLWKNALWAFGLAACTALFAPPPLCAQGEYLDVYIAKVKPEKSAEAEALAAKIADANRRNSGDHVIAMESLYGEGYTYVFVSQRQDYADVEKASDVFMTSLNKAFGKQGAQKLFADWSNCIKSSRSELRRRRPDLSRKMPTDPQSFAKLVGSSRLVRTSAVHLRPGHVPDFEALLKQAKEAGERNAETQPLLVSQLVEGGSGAVFYLSALRSSLAGFDKNPTLKDILGEDAFAKLQKITAESVETTESAIYRFRPEMSYPPDEVAQVAADYWTPKATVVAVAKPKPKTPSGADVTPATAKSAEKPQK